MGLNISGGVTMSGGITLTPPANSLQLREPPEVSGSDSATSYLTAVRNYYDSLSSKPDFYLSDYDPNPEGGITDIFYLSGPKRYYAIMFYGGENYTYGGTTTDYNPTAISIRDGWGDIVGVDLSSGNPLSYMPSTGAIWSSGLAYPTNAQVINMPDINSPNAPVEGYSCVFLESRHRYSNANIINFTKIGGNTRYKYRRGL